MGDGFASLRLSPHIAVTFLTQPPRQASYRPACPSRQETDNTESPVLLSAANLKIGPLVCFGHGSPVTGGVASGASEVRKIPKRALRACLCPKLTLQTRQLSTDRTLRVLKLVRTERPKRIFRQILLCRPDAASGLALRVSAGVGMAPRQGLTARCALVDRRGRRANYVHNVEDTP